MEKTTYMLYEVQVKVARNQNKYLSGKVGNVDIRHPFVCWREDILASPPIVGQLITGEWDEEIVRGDPILTLRSVETISWCLPEQRGKYMVRAAVNADQLLELVVSLLSDSKHLALAKAIVSVPNYTSCSASVSHHQPFFGGLVEHTYRILKGYADLLAAGNPLVVKCDISTVVLGVLAHDIGKTLCYKIEEGSVPSRTDNASRLDHVFAGAMLFTSVVGKLGGVDKKLVLDIMHIIASHSGRKEWGATADPETEEAMLIHVLDYFDANVS
jgi:23S rRNA maturation-related 3'-5' exoribonuclease YhaM